MNFLRGRLRPGQHRWGTWVLLLITVVILIVATPAWGQDEATDTSLDAPLTSLGTRLEPKYSEIIDRRFGPVLLCGAAVVFFGSLVLLAYILVSGYEAKGATRWIRIGSFGLQPSEFAKPSLVVLTGWLLAQRAMYPKGPWAAITLVFFCVTLGFLLLQPDVGQSAL